MDNISFDSQDLINEVKQDIECFGYDEAVYAIYSWFPTVDKEFITDYFYVAPPKKDEYTSEEEYQRLLDDFNRITADLKHTKHIKTSLGGLLKLLKEQNSIL